MATLQVRDIDDRLYDFIKTSAKMQNRSISQEVITIIQSYLNSNQKNTKNSNFPHFYDFNYKSNWPLFHK